MPHILPALRSTIVLPLFLFATAGLHAQISVTPTRVIVESSQRSGEVLVLNPLDRPMVVSTRVMFMVLRNDSTGAIGYDSTLRGNARSCAPWVKVFPHQFTMEPNTRRKVRIMISPPDSIQDGEYMARLELAGLPVDRVATVELDTTTVHTKVNVRLALNIPVVYRKGKLITGIDLNVIGARPLNNRMRVSLGLTPTGNSIYRGTLFSTIIAADGAQVARSETQFVAEVPYIYPLDFPTLAPGQYTLSIESRTVRQGTAGEAVIAAPPSRGEFRLTVDGSAIEVAALH